MKGIITGDVVNSTNITEENTLVMLETIKSIPEIFKQITPVKVEIYRGDGFQATTGDIEYALSVAIAVRLKLKSSTPEDSAFLWDARVSLGLGDISYEGDTIASSKGEAFILSGRTLDNIGKKRLVITSRYKDFDKELGLNTRFADDIITSLTARQADVMLNSLIAGKTQKEIAEDMGITYQNFNSIWNASKGQLILDYISDYKYLLRKYNFIEPES